MHVHVVKTETGTTAGNRLTHEHHQREWKAGMGDRRRGGQGSEERGCKTDRHAERPMGQGADLGTSHCRVERKG